MSNSVKGETPLDLSDGREFVLVLDMEALLSVEEATGKPLPVVMGQIEQGFMSAIAAFGQAAFARHHPEVTRADVLHMVAHHREELAEALGRALDAAFPAPEKAGNVNPPAKKRAGKTSGPSGAKPG